MSTGDLDKAYAGCDFLKADSHIFLRIKALWAVFPYVISLYTFACELDYYYGNFDKMMHHLNDCCGVGIYASI